MIRPTSLTRSMCLQVTSPAQEPQYMDIAVCRRNTSRARGSSVGASSYDHNVGICARYYPRPKASIGRPGHAPYVQDTETIRAPMEPRIQSTAVEHEMIETT